jgi:ATP-dependent RNA helicase DeaD
MNNFEEMGLPPVLTQALDKLGFIHPTPIQAKTIPLALQHKDILGSAQTGTGKTLAFALPLINHLLNNPTGMGLILAPTRELAQQILVSINQLIRGIPAIKTALLIGGDSYDKQLSQLKPSGCIIIGTPGRIIDHLGRRSFKPASINYLILDETDRMFDMGFSEQLEKIVSQLPRERQTLMFSATFPPKIEKLAAKYMQEAERVFVQEKQEAGMVANNLTQETIEIKEGDKYGELLNQLTTREGSILVFVKTKYDADSLALQLGKAGHNVCAIHGNLRQNKRERVMHSFRQGKHRVMVGTDIVARGLDVPHVMHVINYDIPYTPEDYVHRIGRTARAGAKGFAVSFISGPDRKRWKAIQDLLNPSSERPQAKEAHSFARHKRPYSQDRRSYGQDSNRPAPDRRPYAPDNSSRPYAPDRRPYAPENSSRPYSQDRRPYAPENSSRPYSQDRRPYTPENSSRPYSQDRRPYTAGTASTREEQRTGFKPGYQNANNHTKTNNWSNRPFGEKKYSSKQRSNKW